MVTGDYILRAENISKSFPGVRALDGVQLHVERGSVHAVMGENGAGKSTLMKVLIGLCTPDSGQIILKGQPVRFSNVHDALRAGLSMIHQELLPFPELTVAENIFMGNEFTLRLPGWLNRKKANHEARALLERLGARIEVTQKMKELSISEMQMVEIAKAISNRSEVIIMDEPTSAISSREVESLFQIINDLRNQGIAIIYISHKMDEILRIADMVTVMRDGKYITTRKAAELNSDQLISMIVGRDVNAVFQPTGAVAGEIFLEVKNLYGRGFDAISFSARGGEILGIAGLMGSGRTEMVNAIFGLARYSGGEIFVHGRPARISSPKDAIRHGIGLVSEDRKKFGLVLQSSVKYNITLASLHKLLRRGMVDVKKENRVADMEIARLNIKTPSRNQCAGLLSGGNQQKIVIAKVLLNGADIIILDEPTRGIDIGAKMEIYRLMQQLAREGKAVIMISSELPEIIGLSDRILVMRNGTIRATLERGQASQETIMTYAMSS